jgi:hypothetical protein
MALLEHVTGVLYGSPPPAPPLVLLVVEVVLVVPPPVVAEVLPGPTVTPPLLVEIGSRPPAPATVLPPDPATALPPAPVTSLDDEPWAQPHTSADAKKAR